MRSDHEPGPNGPSDPPVSHKGAFPAAAAEEMGAGYAAGLDKYGIPGMFALVLVLSVALAVISERVSEKIIGITE